jgi:hypothetical protein
MSGTGVEGTMGIAQELIGKAGRREALFGIVGLGYVGLPLAIGAQAGFRVLDSTSAASGGQAQPGHSP